MGFWKYLEHKISDILKLSPYHRRRKKYGLGEHSYISHSTRLINTKVGKFCSIASNVVIGIGNHPTDCLSTSPFQYSRNMIGTIGNILVPEENLLKLHYSRPVTEIGNDVWIGLNAVVLKGVKIGDGAVIGAGAIVTKDVPPYAIVAGVPAKIIRYRFPQDIIDKLLELKWWDYPDDFIVTLPFADIEKCIGLLTENKHLKTVAAD